MPTATWRCASVAAQTILHIERIHFVGTGRFGIEVCESLSHSPLCKDWSWDEPDTLSSYMAGYRAKAGDLLFEEGDDADAMGLLLAGQIDVRRQWLAPNRCTAAAAAGHAPRKAVPGRTLNRVGPLLCSHALRMWDSEHTEA